MGLTFDLANPLAVVSEVVLGGFSHQAGVHVGDHLVSSSRVPLFYGYAAKVQDWIDRWSTL